MEFPHLLRLMEENQFDTIYHEHFSYFSLSTVERDLRCARPARSSTSRSSPTHGGSLRIFACHADDDRATEPARRRTFGRREEAAGFRSLERYASFAEQVEETKRTLLEFLIGRTPAGQDDRGYGAPGKGNTLLNYCGIRTDFLDFTVDRNPYKQGRFTPGTHIPIYPARAHRARRAPTTC